jgi:predicted amidophosphoribosyltransferase
MAEKLELTFHSLDTCDGCGSPLAKEEQLSGLCPKCQSPRKPTPKTQARQEAPD